MSLLEAINVSKVYRDAAAPVWVLRDLNFGLQEGELTGIFGASGAGKSTLLHILGAIDEPTSGEVRINSEDLGGMDADALAGFRNRSVGFVFQFYHLLGEFTAVENAMLPALISGMGRAQAERLASESLLAMGLSERLGHRPAMLSGGEQQRVAIARATVLNPPIILADEPTGNLDHESGEQIFEFLLKLNREKGMAVVMVTHNRELLARLPKAYELKDGKLVEMAGGR